MYRAHCAVIFAIALLSCYFSFFEKLSMFIRVPNFRSVALHVLEI